MKFRFACGSMVLFDLLHKKIAFRANFCAKAWNLPPCRRRNDLLGEQLCNSCVDRLLLEKISLAGIARAVQLSERWLQAYFNENYDNVPREVARVGVCLTVV